MIELDAQLLLRAYAVGIFPMAESADSQELSWFDPEPRGILPLDGFHLPKRLKRTLRTTPFEIRFDSAFRTIVETCAQSTAERPTTWINADIVRLYSELHEQGFAHSVETWRAGKLVGGLYGVSLGSAFFGESMFSHETDASKVALVHLVARLRAGGFTLLDTQFVTEHLSRFGAVAIPRADYHRRLAQAIKGHGEFTNLSQRQAMAQLLGGEGDYGCFATQDSTHKS